MNTLETLIELGYEEAGVDLQLDVLNKVEDLLYGSDYETYEVGAAFKYAMLSKYRPAVVAGEFNAKDGLYYSSHFWKLYPENKRK